MVHYILRSILSRLSPDDPEAYRLCRQFVDHSAGDNDGLIARNGERLLADHVLPRCQTVFDVGANVGDWTELAMDINPDLRVHSFEPTPAIYDRLTQRNLPDSVTLVPMGLSSEPGEHTIVVPKRDCGMTSLHGRPSLNDCGLGGETESTTVQLTTADAYLEQTGLERVDLMKIDVEGHELSVLRGAERSLAEGRIGLIQLEYGGAYIDARAMLLDIFSLLKPHGYELFKLYANGLRPAAGYDPRFETFRYSNWVAAHPSRIDWLTPLIGKQQVLVA